MTIATDLKAATAHTARGAVAHLVLVHEGEVFAEHRALCGVRIERTHPQPDLKAAFERTSCMRCLQATR